MTRSPLAEQEIDAAVRAYLLWRADAVARRAIGERATTEVLIRRLGLAGRPPPTTQRLWRYGLALLLLLLALLAAAVAGSLLREQYAPSVPLLRLEMTGRPWGVTAAYGSIWVAAHGEATVYRLEPRTGDVLDTVSIGNPLCGALEPGFGALWFSDCEYALHRLDARTLKTDRLVGHNADRVGIGLDSVWAAHGDAVARLDPSSMETTAEVEIGTGSQLTFGEGSAWAVSPEAGLVFRIDPTTMSIVAAIELARPGPLSSSPVHSVAFAGSLWVVDEGGRQIYRIDAGTNTAQPLDIELEPFAGTSFGDWYITAGRGLVWARAAEDTIVAIDPRSGSIVDRVVTPRGGGGSFVVTADSIWVANNRDDTVWGMALP